MGQFERVWFGVKAAVIVRRPAGLEGLVVRTVIEAPKRLQLWQDATEIEREWKGMDALNQTTTAHSRCSLKVGKYQEFNKNIKYSELNILINFSNLV